MRHILIGAMLIVLFAACRHTTEGPQASVYTLERDTISADSAIAWMPADTTRIYSYQVAGANADSLFEALGYQHSAEMYIDLDYRCADPIGPRPVFIVPEPDTSLPHKGFVAGNRGRFGCATRVVRYVYNNI